MSEASLPPAKQGSKFLILELGRFIAASLVVLTHLVPQINDYAMPGGQSLFHGWRPPGAIGVQYFFVLSGFVMMTAHIKDFGKLNAVWRFWWRRACRIYPVYWLALLIPLYYLYRSLTPLLSFQIFSLAPGVQENFIPPAWTLRYEVEFYLMFGLCLLPKIGKPFLLLWFLLTFWGWATPEMIQFLHMPSPAYLDTWLWGWKLVFISSFNFYFFAGLAVGFIYRKCCPNGVVSSVLLLLGLGVVLDHMPAIDWGNGYGSPGVMMIVAPALALILLGLVGLEQCGWLKLSRHCGFAGAVSYPLYIFHTALMLVIATSLPKLHLHLFGLVVCFLLELGIIYAVAGLVTRYFDQPLQKFLRTLFKPKKQASLG